ncbi:alpha/beta hydrolase [Paraferrimonas sedimenticola]|uniref:Alpha/beta hydrolase n=1 Tax=Paraferrimonas sedimenticola TaxID=375674 RepID=A0AA37RSA1_9GAMM|nr:alpha/beta fold hydrolase [Paraferrimonas sedimenticola]GLP94774.1 alpha/beta hydrolase [Paraferrimonas sedimenticola]
MRTLVLLLGLSVYAAIATPLEREVKLTLNSGQVHGVLLEPSQPTQVAALLIAGSGPTDRNGNNPRMQNNSLKMLAEGLAANGVASLRYDKRGIAASHGAGADESQLRFEHYVDDAVAWLAQLSNKFGYQKVVVIGHSEGSMIAMLAAARAGSHKVVSIAGPGERGDKLIDAQLSAHSPPLAQQARPILDKLVAGETIVDTPAQLAPLFRPSVQPYLKSWFRHDPQQAAAKLTQPLLIVQGTSDIQVGVAHAEYLKAAQPDAEVVIIEGMNHVLKPASMDYSSNLATYNQPELPLSEALLPAIVEFVLE